MHKIIYSKLCFTKISIFFLIVDSFFTRNNHHPCFFPFILEYVNKDLKTKKLNTKWIVSVQIYTVTITTSQTYVHHSLKKINRKLTHLTWLMWVILGLKIGKIKPFFYFALSDINEIGKIKPFLYFAFSDINALQALFYFYLYWYLNCSHIVKVYCH